MDEPLLEIEFAGIKILLYLLKGGEAALSVLRRNTALGFDALYRVIPKLLKYNLVVERRVDVRRVFTLTPKGVEVANLLREASRRIKG